MNRSRTNTTLGKLLEDLKKDLPNLKVGMFFETIKSIYPTEDIAKENKNIILEGEVFTKPLALSKKEKKEMIKEESPFVNFFNEKNKGDYLKIIKKEDGIYYCKNISLKEEIIDKYYKNDNYIKITDKDIISNSVKPIIRIRHSYLYSYMEEK